MFKIFGVKPKVFITDERHLENMESQMRMLPQTLNQLREYGVDDSKSLKLEFFFYTNTSDKAAALSEKLFENGYESAFEVSASNKKLFIVTGLTTPIQMTADRVIEWAGKMCVLGHRQDCEFDGWGTNPDQ